MPTETQEHPLVGESTISISRNGNHQYWIDDGPKRRSVTTMAKHVDGDLFGAGMGWALKQVTLNNGDVTAPRRIATESVAVGNRLHEAINRYIEGGVVAEEDPLFLAWFHTVGQQQEWLASERFVFHAKLIYGGTVDVLSRDDRGKIIIWDWKTRERDSYQNSGGYLHEQAQLAAYTDALRAMGSIWAPSSGYIVYVMRDATGRQLPGDVDVVEVDLAYGSKLFNASRTLFLLTQGGA